jgi:large-conductance mechanosensitive channel
MGRNEIRLRRQMMSSGRIAQHRNYGDIMARHERDIKIKRIIKAFTYFLIIAFMIIVFLMVRRIQEKQSVKPGKASATLSVPYASQQGDSPLAEQ